MELELMNLFHLYLDGRCIVIRANLTKKQLTEEIKEYAKNEPVFKPVKFRQQMINKGVRFYYEQM